MKKLPRDFYNKYFMCAHTNTKMSGEKSLLVLKIEKKIKRKKYLEVKQNGKQKQ